MRVVIAGGGNVGTYIAGELSQAGHEVLIIEVDPDRVARAVAACGMISTTLADQM